MIYISVLLDSDVGESEMGGPGGDIYDYCIVKINVVKLRGLKTGALFGHANPYVAFALGTLREKTCVKWGGKTDWTWTSTLSFRISSAKLQTCRLAVRVYDKERIRRKKLLGEVFVKLSGLQLTDIQSWFALEGGDRSINGDVYLGIQLV